MTSKTNLTINPQRLWDSLMETARFGGTPKGGIKRLTVTDDDKRVRDWFKAECEKLADHYLGMMGIAKFAESYPHELSGGMQQRAALARALISQPSILLMDEPFAALDAQTREFMQIEVMKIRHMLKGVVVFVTHSVDEAILLSDKIVMLSPRPGKIAELLDVNLPHPRWDHDIRATAEFLNLRQRLWEGIRTMVLNDPQSDFYQRDKVLQD